MSWFTTALFSKAEDWLEAYRGHAAVTPFDAVQKSDVVFACLGRDEDVREVVQGSNGVFTGMKAGSAFC